MNYILYIYKIRKAGANAVYIYIFIFPGKVKASPLCGSDNLLVGRGPEMRQFRGISALGGNPLAFHSTPRDVEREYATERVIDREITTVIRVRHTKRENKIHKRWINIIKNEVLTKRKSNPRRRRKLNLESENQKKKIKIY